MTVVRDVTRLQPVRRIRANQRLVTFALAIAVGVAVAWRIFLEPGVVGLVHDWSILPFAQQNVAFFQQLSGGWLQWGLGERPVYPTEYPWRALLAALSLFGASGAFVSKAFVAGIPAGAFLAAVYLGRRLGFPPAAAWLCGAFYALDPVMLNKLVSGQAAYLIGYAALPLVPATFLQAGRKGFVASGIALGGALGLAAIELQTGLMGLALLVAFAVVGPRSDARRNLLVLMVAAFVLLAIEAPTLVGLFHGTAGIEARDEFHHRLTWLRANALDPLDAVRLTGYLTHYDAQSLVDWLPLWVVVSWGVLAVVALGFLRAPAVIWRSALLILPPAFALACGAKIPWLAGPISTLFDRLPVMQAFREVYHLMALASLYYAVAFGAVAAASARLQRPLRVASGVLLTALLGAYVAPILSGDVSGWLAAAPYDTYLARVFAAENRGAGRVAWFPMDQPLGYVDRGAGVDPMSVTSRGSLWQYALAWPLTALDIAARNGDVQTVRAGLQAFGVGDAVERDRFFSRVDSFTTASSPFGYVFWGRPRLGPQLGTQTPYGSDLRAYHIAAPLPLEFAASRYAIVPPRFSTLAAVAAGGTPVFTYDQVLPGGLPFDLYLDRGDSAFETLEYAGEPPPDDRLGVNAHTGFAGNDVWWWYRQAYADARRAALVIGRGTLALHSAGSYHDARAVIAWIATPVGGRLQVECGATRTTLDSGGSWNAWRSQAIPCGPLRASDQLVLTALDRGAEVALRGVKLIEASRLEAETRSFTAFVHGAGHVYVIDANAGRLVRTVRGKGPRLGTIPAGFLGRLSVAGNVASGTVVRIEGPGGSPFGWRRLGAGISAIPFLGTGEPLVVRSSSPLSAWQLTVFAPKRPSAAPPARDDAHGRLVVFGQAFDDGWQGAGARAHLQTAFGTSAYLFDRSRAELPRITYVYAWQYRAAVVLGLLALAFALVFLGASIAAGKASSGGTVSRLAALPTGRPRKTRESASLS